MISTPNRLVKFFGQIGQIKDDKKSREPGKKKVWIYRDKSTGAAKGDATVTYLDPNGAKYDFVCSLLLILHFPDADYWASDWLHDDDRTRLNLSCLRGLQ